MAKKNHSDVKNEDINTFPLGRLREDCISLFGVSSATFDGATADLSGNEFTVDEVKQKIKDWLNKPIKGGN